MRILPLVTALLLVTGCTAGSKDEQRSADIIFTNGTVLTVDESNRFAESVAVTDNKIVFVGSAEEATAFAGDNTQVLDLDGRMLTPGFVSGHDHLISSGFLSFDLSLYGATSKEETVKLIREYAESNPDIPVVLGIGWAPAIMGGMPTMAELDAIVPDRPALFVEANTHEAWFNSKALEVGNIPADAKDRQPGVTYWVRDDDGNMTGIAYEFQWIDLYLGLGLWDIEAMLPGIHEPLAQLAIESGYTTILVPGVGLPSALTQEGQHEEVSHVMEYLAGLEAGNKLMSRTFAAPMFKGDKTDPAELAEFARGLGDQYNSDVLAVKGVKIHPEAGLVVKNAPMLTPYEGTDHKGDFGVSPERTMALVQEANKRDLDVYIHVEGNASVRAAINAFEASIKAGNDARNSLHHLAFVTPEDYQRILDLDLMVNATPQFSTSMAGQSEYLVDYLGADRVEEQLGRYTDLAHDGATVSISGDYPGTPAEMISPLFNMQVAMTLIDPSDPDSVPFPDVRKRMTLEQAIRAVTIDAARFVRMEEKLGSIEVGKLADLVVLEQDIRAVPVNELKDVKVQAVMMDGEFRFRDGF